MSSPSVNQQPGAQGQLSVLEDIPRGAPQRNGKDTGLEHHTLPNSEFRRPTAIGVSKGLAYGSNKIFLGVTDGQVVARPRPDGRVERNVLGGLPIGSADDRPMMTIAGSRSGKGRSVIIPTLLGYGGSAIVTDPKGELFNITARHRASLRRGRLRHKVVGIDPFKISRGTLKRHLARFNPMSILKPDSPTLIEDAGHIADAIVVVSSKDSHWDDSARNWLETIILHVATAPEYAAKRTLVTVYKLLMRGLSNESDAMEALGREMEENAAAGGAVQEGAIAFFSKPEEERGSIISTAQRHAKFLSYPAIQESVSGHDFDLSELKTGFVTLYLCMPPSRLATCRGWLRLFVNLLIKEMESNTGRPDVPVLAILDEFAALGHMKVLEDSIAYLSGYGVRLWPIIQDLSQLKSLYRDRWETFLGNAGLIQCFGNNDLTTLEWISKRLGKTSLIVTRQSEAGPSSRDRQGLTGESWSAEVQDLMTPEEVGRFFAREDHLCRQLILRPGDQPMILQRVNYDTHQLFEGKYDDYN